MQYSSNLQRVEIKQLQDAVPNNQTNQVTINIPQMSCIDLNKSYFQCVITLTSANDRRAQKYATRQDCQINLQSPCQVLHDGVVIAQFQNLAASQYQAYYSSHEIKKCKINDALTVAVDGLHNHQKNLVYLGIGENANVARQFSVRYQFKHFLPFIFENEHELKIDQQMSISLQINNSIANLLYSAIAGQTLYGAQTVEDQSKTISFSAVLFVKQNAIAQKRTHINFLTQYQQTGSTLCQFQCAPSGVLTKLGILYSTLPTIAGENAASITRFPATHIVNVADLNNLYTQPLNILLNGLAIVQKGATIYDLQNQLQALKSESDQDSMASEAILETSFQGQTVQLNIQGLSADIGVFVTFVDTVMI